MGDQSLCLLRSDLRHQRSKVGGRGGLLGGFWLAVKKEGVAGPCEVYVIGMRV